MAVDMAGLTSVDGRPVGDRSVTDRPLTDLDGGRPVDVG